MTTLTLRELTVEDKRAFLAAMQESESLHGPWLKVPKTSQEFDEYWQRVQQPNQKAYLLCDQSGKIAGVFNLSEIGRGLFQSAYMGYYAVLGYEAKGNMSAGLKLVLAKIFNELKLHRVEANIMPENTRSIALVKKNGFRCEGFSPRYLKINGQWRGHERWALTYEDYICEDPDVLKKDKVALEDYSPEWPNKAKLEIERLWTILPASRIVDIQHVGSTAIPGIKAKPIVDIQVAVKSLDEMKIIAVPTLQKLEYEYWQDNPDPERLFFVKGMPPYGEKRTFHVHIMEPSSKHWIGKLAFRDYLRSHPEMAKEYEQLKIKLAKQHAEDREAYTAAKTEFVNKVLELAKASKP